MIDFKEIKPIYKIIIIGTVMVLGGFIIWYSIFYEESASSSGNGETSVSGVEKDTTLFSLAQYNREDYLISPDKIMNNEVKDNSTETKWNDFVTSDSLPILDVENTKPLDQPKRRERTKNHATKVAKPIKNNTDDNSNDIYAKLESSLSKTSNENSGNDATSEFSADKLIAVIYGDQTIRAGSRVRLRVVEGGQLGGINVARNTVIYGTATFGSKRLLIDIDRIVQKRETKNLHVRVFDINDGQEGIYVKGVDVATETKSSIGNIGRSILSQGGAIGNAAGNLIAKGLNQEEEIFLFNNSKVIIQLNQ